MKKLFEIKVEWTKKGMLFSKRIEGVTNVEKLGIAKYLKMDFELEAYQSIKNQEEKKVELKTKKS